VGCSERKKEIRRRRHRREKFAHFRRKLATANASDKQNIANKVWQLSPGAAVVVKNWGLES
jgi:hypothetical protein